jgi:hypothetical protein
MLDGLGGIHTYPTTLSKPDSLPYFGFDIARNLEVKIVDGKREFYLLDGFGVVHSTDPNHQNTNSIYFGMDWARDLEPSPTSDEWMVMDEFGTIYIGEQPNYDVIRYDGQFGNHEIICTFSRSNNSDA